MKDTINNIENTNKHQNNKSNVKHTKDLIPMSVEAAVALLKKDGDLLNQWSEKRHSIIAKCRSTFEEVGGKGDRWQCRP